MRNFRQESQAAEARKKAGELYHASLAEHDEDELPGCIRFFPFIIHHFLV